jgi:cytoskeletal protein CcmA (bactofilin family)
VGCLNAFSQNIPVTRDLDVTGSVVSDRQLLTPGAIGGNTVSASDTISGASNAAIAGTITGGKVISTSIIESVGGSFSGRLGVGTTSPTDPFHLDGGQNEVVIGPHGLNSLQQVTLFRNDTSILPGDGLGYLGFAGADTTGNTRLTHAFIGAEAEFGHVAGDNPTNLVFYTTHDTSDVPVKSATISGTGDMSVIGSIVSSRQLLTQGAVGGNTVSASSTISGGSAIITKGDSGLVNVNAVADVLVLKNNGSVGMTLSKDGSGTSTAVIIFASGTDPAEGILRFLGGGLYFSVQLPESPGGSLSDHFFVDGDGVNPAGTPANKGNFISDGYDSHPSFAQKDGVDWKVNIKDALTKNPVAIKDLKKTVMPVIYEFDRTKESYLKTAAEFDDEKVVENGEEIVIKTAEEQADEYNATVEAKTNQQGFIVETLDEKYLSRDNKGEVVGIKQDIALMDIIIDLQKRVAVLEGK